VTVRVFENRVLRRIFGPKTDEVTGGWRKMHNEELHGLYSSPSIVRVIKARRMRWVGHVAQICIDFIIISSAYIYSQLVRSKKKGIMRQTTV
jgi:hypothetical protein